MGVLRDLWRRDATLCVALLIAALTIVRLVVVIATPLEIGPDEAQYWRWSRTLDFGYYSKPPLIAWVIGASTAMFGNAEWAIRFFTPILHGLAAWFLFLLGKRAFDARVGAWSAAIYLLMPGIWLSSTIMSTDAVLLPAWAAALYFLWRFRDSPGLGNAALAGIAIGLAMLAKYAALYLYVGAGLAALVDRDMRRALLSPAGIVLVVASLLLTLAPNLWWNAANNFATVSHTADNADLGEASFDVLHVFDFIQDQAAVFGPITLIVLVAGFAFVMRRKDKWTSTREVWLACFIIPPLGVILVQEIISRAHANWAATAYPAACVLLAAWIDRAFGGETGRFKLKWPVRIGVGLNTIIGIGFTLFWVMPPLADSLGATNALKRLRGWEQTASELGAIAKQHNATAIMLDEREIWHGIDYYGRDMGLPPLRAWQRGDTPRSHAEEAGKVQPGEDQNALIASYVPEFRPMIREDFSSITELGYIHIPLGPKKERVMKLYLGSGYHPQKRTPEFEKRHETMSEE